MNTSEQLAALDDDTFERYLMRAVKNRHEQPKWWAAFLDPLVVDGAEDVLIEKVEDVKRQLAEGGSPKAKRFLWTVQEALDEIALDRIVRGDAS